MSGEASQAFWVVAPATPAPRRHLRLITIGIVMGFYLLLMDPIRRNDARMEKWIERGAAALHRNVGALLSSAGTLMARTGSTLRQAGQNLHKRAACL